MFKMEEPSNAFRLLDLPEIVVEQILGYLSYEELSHFRVVCQRFNHINQSLLNKGFRRVEQYQAKCLKEVKSQLPRRESERRNHPLYRHCDVLTAIETRLSLLNMTFMKYVDCQMCCFIPGKVIDEIYRILRFVQNHKTLPRSHEILTELRDISSMAMEHFEEKIIKTLKPASISSSPRSFSLASTMPLSSLTSELTSFAAGNSTPSSSSGNSLSKPHLTPQYLMASNKSVISGLKKDISDLKSKIHDLRRKVSEQERVALEQNRILSEQTTKLIGQEAKQNEINRKLLEYEQRFTELFAEITRLKEESGGGGGNVLNWQTNNKNNKFYVSHTVTSTPALGSLFVAGSMMQPNLVPLNLAAAQMSPTSYLASSQLGAYPSSLAFTMDPSTHVSSSSVYSTSPLNSSGAQADSSLATNFDSLPSTSGQNTKDRANNEEDNTEMRPPKSPVKKRSKKKQREMSEVTLNVFKKRRMDEK